MLLITTRVCRGRIVIQHVGQDVLRILQPLGHLLVVRVERLAEGHDRPFALFIHVGHQSVVRVQQYLGMVLEIHLHDLIRQAKHNGMAGPHPLFHVDGASRTRRRAPT